MLLIDAAVFEGDAEALFMAHPAQKCKVMEVPVIPKDEFIRFYVAGRDDNMNHEFSNEEIREAQLLESDEVMRRHFRKAGLR